MTGVEWMTTKQVADKANRHVNRVREALENGSLHGHQRKFRGPWIVDPACVDPWLLGLDSRAACRCRELRSNAKRAA